MEKRGCNTRQKPEWNKKKSKTTTNLQKHVQTLLSPISEESSCYSVFMDKKFVTKDILD
jgi:hypothetical protein